LEKEKGLLREEQAFDVSANMHSLGQTGLWELIHAYRNTVSRPLNKKSEGNNTVL
jgi:hypothetical protein